MSADRYPYRPAPREGVVSVQNTWLYAREIGEGQPVIILHGGPDFDHNYFLPELDRLAASSRLIYYDQRGRGKSAADVRPEEVSIASEIEDLEAVRQHFQLETATVLGHSWGGLLAMEYAIRRPGRVSNLILMNGAPASHADYLLHRQRRHERAPAAVDALAAMRSSENYRQGDIEADLEYYRIHFRLGLRNPEHVERIVQRLRVNFTPEGILKAREIEDRLVEETWLRSDYDLIPGLRQLRVPALVIHGDHDLVPVECAAHVSEAIPAARFVLLKDCGHFSFIEAPDEVYIAIDEFFRDG